MSWKAIKIVMALAIAFVSTVFFLMFAFDTNTIKPRWWGNPHMNVQAHLREYDARMPVTPPGAVAVEENPWDVPTQAAAQARVNPLAPATPQTLSAGRIYYEYYCLPCHGTNGDGHGPVGESYVPAPTDLRAPRLANYSDGQLLRAMLTGTGHSPVLQRVVHPQHRWPLAAYVKSLSEEKKRQTASLHPNSQ